MFYKGLHSVDIIGTENGTAFYISDRRQTRQSKLHYTPFKTWDQYLGNVPAGQYFVARFDNGQSARCYLSEFAEYR